MSTTKWRLKGYDTFEGEYYDLDGQYENEQEAQEAARRRLSELEVTQPSSSSGGATLRRNSGPSVY